MGTNGFYKIIDGVLQYAPEGVYAPMFTLTNETKDDFVYPVDGWHWFETEAEAKSFFGLDLVEMKQALLADLALITADFANYVVRCNEKYGLEPMPEELVILIQTVTGMRNEAIAEINALPTREEASTYILRGNEVAGIYEQFNYFLQ